MYVIIQFDEASTDCYTNAVQFITKFSIYENFPTKKDICKFLSPDYENIDECISFYEYEIDELISKKKIKSLNIEIRKVNLKEILIL